MPTTDTATQTVNLGLLADSLAELYLHNDLPRPNYLTIGSSARIGLSYYTLADASQAANALGINLREPYRRTDGGWQADADATLNTGQRVNIVGVASEAERAEIDAASEPRIANGDASEPETYICGGCGKVGRVAAHWPGCAVAAAFDARNETGAR